MCSCVRRRSCALCSLLVTRGARPPCEPVRRTASCAASGVCGWQKSWCARVRVKLRECLQHEEYLHTPGLPRNTACGRREPQVCGSWEYFFLRFLQTALRQRADAEALFA
uniref:Putative secreted protein n=1 Tax=Ixodes ricinus TaxID=34613 RepID=A0A6B0UJ28_IXORI